MTSTAHVDTQQTVPRRLILAVYLGYTAVLVGLFGGLALADQPQFIGNFGSDLYQQFLSWRAWGFGQIAAGHLPLWNPHVFSGAPFLGGFQSALFYPPNWIFIVLPLQLAVNGCILFHLMLFAALMFHWALSKRMAVLPAALVGLIAMLNGTYFLHIYAGHLTNLCAMAWIPLVLRAVESVIASPPAPGMRAPDLRWSLYGALAVAMQIFAGHPQYVYYTAVTICVFCLLNARTILVSPRILFLLLVIPVLACLLTSVQLLPGWQATAESVRGQPLSFAQASTYNFPPENLLTALLPDIYGPLSTRRYFGRAFLWETSIFMGAGVLFLAAYALTPWLRGTQATAARNPDLWRYPVMVLVTLVIAMGVSTPLYQVLYDFLPGFSKFRGVSKFIALANIYMALLAGWGLQRLLTERHIHRLTPPLLGAVAVGLLLLSLAITPDTIQAALLGLARTGQSWNLAGIAADGAASSSLARIAMYAASVSKTAVSLGAVAFLLLALVVQLSRRKPQWTWCIALVPVTELLVYAHTTVESFPVQATNVQGLSQFFLEHPGDARSANAHLPNLGMLYNGYDVDGVDPSVEYRYEDLLYYLQGRKLGSPDETLNFDTWYAAYDMIRLGYLISMVTVDNISIKPVGNPLPKALLVGSYRVLPTRESMFAAIKDPAFDPRQSVLLEVPPEVQPAASVQGTVKLLSEGSDELTLQADLDQAGILLVTDLYSPSWRVESLEPGTQDHYQLLPANYILRAVPLQAGHHRLRFYYDRSWLHAGMLLSGIGLLLTLAGGLLPHWLSRRRNGQRIGQVTAD